MAHALQPSADMARLRSMSRFLLGLTAMAAASGLAHAKAPAPNEAPSPEQRRRELVLHRLTSLGNDRVRGGGTKAVRVDQTVGWFGARKEGSVSVDAAFAALLGPGELRFNQRGGQVQVLWRGGAGTTLLGQLRTVGDEEIFVPTKRVAEETRRTIGEALLAAVGRLSGAPVRPTTDSTWLEPVLDPKAPAGTQRISFEPRWRVAHGGVERPDWTYGDYAADALKGPLEAIRDLLYTRPGLGAEVKVAWVSDRRRDGSSVSKGQQVQHRLTFRRSYAGGGALYEEKVFTPGAATGSRARRREARQHAGWWKAQLARAKQGEVPEREWAVAQVVLHAKEGPSERKKTVPNLALAGIYGEGKLVFEGGRRDKARPVLWQRADGTREALGRLVQTQGALVFEPRPELLAGRNAVVGEALLAALAGRAEWKPYDLVPGVRLLQSSPMRDALGMRYYLDGQSLPAKLRAALPPGLRELLDVQRYGKPVELRWTSNTVPASWSRFSSRKLREDQVVEHALRLSDEPFHGPQLVYEATIRYRYPALQAPRRLEEVADRRIALDAPRVSLSTTRLEDVVRLKTREEIETYVARLYLEHTHFSDDVAGIYDEALSARRTGAWVLAPGTEPLWREAFAKVGCISSQEALKRVSRRPAFKALVTKLAALEAAQPRTMWHELAVAKLTSRDEVRTFIALYRQLFPDLALSYIYNGGVNGHPSWRAFAQGTKEIWLDELRAAGAFENALR